MPNQVREVTTARGVERETVYPSGAVSRVLVEPSAEYEAERQARREAHAARERQRAQEVLDEIAALETANLGQLRAYVIAQAKERLHYEEARRILESEDEPTRQ